jgi:hypothetical protein
LCHKSQKKSGKSETDADQDPTVMAGKAVSQMVKAAQKMAVSLPRMSPYPLQPWPAHSIVHQAITRGW